MQLDIVTPERRLASVEITAAEIPGMQGDLTVMPNHAPFLTTLRPGVLTVTGAEGTSAYVVTGGFAEVSPEAASVLAEFAIPMEEATADSLASVLAEAEATFEAAASDDGKTAAALRVNDLKQLIARLG